METDKYETCNMFRQKQPKLCLHTRPTISWQSRRIGSGLVPGPSLGQVNKKNQRTGFDRFEEYQHQLELATHFLGIHHGRLVRYTNFGAQSLARPPGPMLRGNAVRALGPRTGHRLGALDSFSTLRLEAMLATEFLHLPNQNF